MSNSKWAAPLLRSLLLLSTSLTLFHPNLAGVNALLAERKSLNHGPVHPAQLSNYDPLQSIYTTFTTAASAAGQDVAVSAVDQSRAARIIATINAQRQQSDKAMPTSSGSKDSETNLPVRVQASAQALLATLSTRSVSWTIRSDSYTDSVSGLSHVYAKAHLNHYQGDKGQLLIDNADVNINIASDGQILSFGNSLYTRASDGGINVDPALLSLAQSIPTNGLSSSLATTGEKQLVDPRLALVHFLAHASPHRVESAALRMDAEAIAQKMRLRFQLQPTVAAENHARRQSGYEIQNAPSTVNEPVHAHLAWLQVPSTTKGAEEEMELKLVWKMNVMMKNNAYEVALDAVTVDETSAAAADSEQRTLSVVDWVKSSPIGGHGHDHARLQDLKAPDFMHYGSSKVQEQKPMVVAAERLEELADSGFYMAPLDTTATDAGDQSSSIATAAASQDKNLIDELLAEDFGADPQLKVFQWGFNSPSDGIRTIENGVRPHSPASPLGWHRTMVRSDPFAGTGGGDDDDEPWMMDAAAKTPRRTKDGKYVIYKDTRGNNVLAASDPQGAGDWKADRRPLASRVSNNSSKKTTSEQDAWIFDFPFPWRAYDKNHTDLPGTTYTEAATTQLFYTCSRFHDLLWGYGFDEVSGNFQADNFDRGGKGGDPVIAFSQDGAGMNNADFMTPPDGQKPRMRMYLWSGTPERDGDFEEGIVLHEYSHGLTTRLTGGPANSGCLGWGEAGGYGEGAGDVMATIVRRKHAKMHDWTMGEWASHTKGGIRHYPYSTNMTINVETYETLNKPGYFGVHAIGEVWSTMVNELVESMITKYGFTQDLFIPLPNATQAERDAFYFTEQELQHGGLQKRKSKRSVPRHGNTMTVQLLIDAMKLQPCRPSFHDLRDAIVQADENLTGGNNTCTIWTAFAKRGLGTDSKVVGQTPWGGGIRNNGFKLPAACKSKA